MPFREDDAHHSAQQRAYQYIRDRIVDGSIAGGTKLNPAAIAGILGISRMPVREAIVQLDTEGLVTNRPNRGAIVTPLEPEDVEELFEMRAALEGLAARRAAERITDAQLEELEALAERMERVSADAQQWLRLHDEFHDLICVSSGRRRLVAEIRRIRASVRPYLLLYNRVYERAEMEGAEHLALVAALRSHNSVLAERTFSHHVATASIGVINFLRHRQEQQALAG
ncbi:GntR family transcriptional regulator [Azospirillum sp. ST 5-10]|uniref:GntR family transcriptional regulator n=1 Tax=unclassified Azospirillum TaxID=2630922 RepID=UPI003F4A6C57